MGTGDIISKAFDVYCLESLKKEGESELCEADASKRKQSCTMIKVT